MDGKNRKKIAILFGGCSSEYEVSLQSAYAVAAHMDTTAGAGRKHASLQQFPQIRSCMGSSFWMGRG